MRIDKSIFRYIEHELYNYDETKRELIRLKEEIIEGSHFIEVPAHTSPGNPTEQKAIKLTTSAHITYLEKVASAIDRSLNILGDRHKELFKCKYEKGLPWQEVALEMDISDRTYFRIRRELVAMVAQQMGLINAE